jgi:hypothetical protein
LKQFSALHFLFDPCHDLRQEFVLCQQQQQQLGRVFYPRRA